MKEIIKKIVIAVVVVAIAIGVAVKFIKGDEPAVDGTTTTAAAVAGDNKNEGANADSGSNGSENALPTDSQGNVNTDSNSNGNANSNSGSNADSNVNANSNGNSNSASNGNSNGNSNAATNNGGSVQNNPGSSDNGSAVQGTTGGQSSSQGTSSQTPSYEGNGNTAQTVTQNGQIAQPDNGNAQQPQEYANKIDVYQEIFASGRFIMKINDPDLGPVTMGMSGNKMFIDASMEGVNLKMLYDGDKPDKDNPDMGTWYIVIDEIKKYSPMPADMLGDMDVEDLVADFSDGPSDNVYTKSTETIGGQTYDCESQVDENGNTTKYYFKGDVLVRSDSISPSGEISTTEFQEISGNVDESLFAIPEGYAKFDISWLLNMVA